MVAAGAQGRPKTLDDEFDDFVDLVPGFAGMYYDSTGAPVVLMTDRTGAAAADVHVHDFALRHPWRRGAAPKAARYMTAKYDFRQLRHWHDAVFRTVASMADLTYTDIDEVNNVVKIAVKTADAARAVLAVAASLNIPPDAISVPVVAPFHFQQAGQDLTDAIRPALGGTQVSTPIGNCTLGFNTQKVKYEPVTGSYVYDHTHLFVTASHCMQTPGEVTPTRISQGPFFASDYYIGWETRQPPWDNATYGNCPAGYRCSLADAALVGYLDGDGSMAAIAHPTGNVNSGETTIDVFTPTWVIVDSTQNSGNSMAGTLVSKVGKASGWTNGFLSGTCFNQPAYWSGFYLLCQDSYSAANADGDSGSPIFQVDVSGQYARIVGIHWGGTGSEGAYSPYVYVRYELTRADLPTICGSDTNCWLGLNVSGVWQ